MALVHTASKWTSQDSSPLVPLLSLEHGDKYHIDLCSWLVTDAQHVLGFTGALQHREVASESSGTCGRASLPHLLAASLFPGHKTGSSPN